MNKYKVGDKFITEIIAVRKGIEPYMLKLKDGGDWIADEAFLDQLQLMEVEQTMTAEEAWETARQILFKEELFTPMLEEIFGTRNHFAIMRDFTPQEAKAKIDAWEKAKEEIKVGDVLQHKITKFKCVVTDADGGFYVLWWNGEMGDLDEEETYGNFEKTGEHIDIESVLKQLGE